MGFEPDRARGTREMQMPPGSARASRRAVTLTPSPKMSSPSTMTSPRLMPIRKSISISGGTAEFRSAMPRWISTAQRTGKATLARVPFLADLILTGKPVDVVELWESCLSSDAFGS
jgi:hypothetical protein